MPNIGELTFEESASRQFGLRCIVSDQALHNYVFDNMWLHGYTLDVPDRIRQEVSEHRRTNVCFIGVYGYQQSLAELNPNDLAGRIITGIGGDVTARAVGHIPALPATLTDGRLLYNRSFAPYLRDFGQGLARILYYNNIYNNGIDRPFWLDIPGHDPTMDLPADDYRIWESLEPILRTMFNPSGLPWRFFPSASAFNNTPSFGPGSIGAGFFFLSDANFMGSTAYQLLDPTRFGTFPRHGLCTLSFTDALGTTVSNFENNALVRISAIEQDNLVDLSHFDVRFRNISGSRGHEAFAQVFDFVSPPNRPIPLTQTPTRIKLTGAPEGNSFEIWARDEGSSSTAIALDENDRPVQQSALGIMTRYDPRIKPRQYILLPDETSGWVIESIRQVGRRKFMELELRR